MSQIFNPEIVQVSQVTAVAKLLMQHGNDTFKTIVSRYDDAYNTLWHRDDWNIQDAQACLDAMGPGGSVSVFQISGSLGVFINTIVPNTIPEERLSPPVSYTVEMIEGIPRIVLDPEGVYPGPIESV